MFDNTEVRILYCLVFKIENYFHLQTYEEFINSTRNIANER